MLIVPDMLRDDDSERELVTDGVGVCVPDNDNEEDIEMVGVTVGVTEGVRELVGVPVGEIEGLEVRVGVIDTEIEGVFDEERDGGGVLLAESDMELVGVSVGV